MTVATIWAEAPSSPSLQRGEVAIWRLPADTTDPIQCVLGRHLGVRPGDVVLRRTPAGKPEAVGSKLRVNLAHSGDVGLVAVALEQVGVDVERLRPGIDGWSLVDHVLSSSERARLRSLPPARRAEEFLSVWTRKEALLKAAGFGLTLDPRLIELEGRQVVAAPPELRTDVPWTLADLRLPGYAAAMAVRGHVSRVLLYDARAKMIDSQLIAPADGGLHTAHCGRLARRQGPPALPPVESTTLLGACPPRGHE